MSGVLKGPVDLGVLQSLFDFGVIDWKNRPQGLEPVLSFSFPLWFVFRFS